MRWDSLAATAEDQAEATPALLEQGARPRTFATPEFRGMTFYEVRARSIVNEVSPTSQVPFRLTINPYRGCSHGCVGCFARRSHTYLDLDAGEDFNSRVVVKVNAAEVVRAELARPRWRSRNAGAHIAMGTNVDCYQRAEGRYRLMPGIIAALRDFGHPFSILTRGPLILRDLELIGAAAEKVEVGVSVSVPFVDDELSGAFEPGAARPGARLRISAAFNEAGLGCGVLMAPILPYLSDSPRQLEATVRAIAETGATSITPIVLHLRPGAREWYMAWLGEHYPELVPRYTELYRGSSYAPRAYQRRVTERVRALARAYGIVDREAKRGHRGSGSTSSPPSSTGTQLSLL
ncbi:Rv2578c family radical SAM protein [Salinactinospora qingdaonensis]|uniref:Rv2578c family radical SAM protein n=1 Tax=Salinactinospora qingdaonensis TaxID=702744 RepID=A0ABP7F1A1_9ACTN